MKISISKKIIALVVVPLMLVVIVSSLFSSVLLGSVTLDEIEKQLSLATYAMQKETEQMSAQNTKIATVETLISDFKESNGIDITIFSYDTRVFSTVPNAVGTQMDSTILAAIKGGKDYFSKNANVNGEKYYAYYVPILQDGEYVGAFFAGEPAARMDSMIIQNMLKMILITMCLGVITIIIGVVVAKRIVRKINDLKIVLDALSDNDLSQSHEKYSVEHDELEELKNGTVEIKEQLKSIVKTIQKAAGSLNEVSFVLKENVQSTNENSNQISDAIENVAGGAVSQAEETSNAAQNIGEMSSELERIRDNANELHGIANSMDSAKNNAMNTLNQLQEVNAVMIGEVESTRNQVDATSESVEKAQEVITVITSIADQTKLLSLNASIEAARAGEHGKGFAVVAEEIGKLANQSAQSSNQIKEILEQLVKNYGVIIQSVKSITDNMVVQNGKLEETQSVFAVLENDITGTVGKVEEINDMIETVNVAIKSMVDMISNLSAISEENSAATEQTQAAVELMNETIKQIAEKAQNVNESAEALMKEVSVFKTE